MAKFFKVGKKMRVIIFLLGTLLTLSLTQCASFDSARRIHQQGNLLPQAKINRLKLGMTKNDVAILMGTSLLSPTFTNNRWDYAYTWRRGHGNIIMQNLTLYFSKDVLIRIEHNP